MTLPLGARPGPRAARRGDGEAPRRRLDLRRPRLAVVRAAHLGGQRACRTRCTRACAEGGAVTFACAAALTLGLAHDPGLRDLQGRRGRRAGSTASTSWAARPVCAPPSYRTGTTPRAARTTPASAGWASGACVALEALLPDDAFVLGVDEHTGLVIDLDSRVCEVVGSGTVVVRVHGDEWVAATPARPSRSRDRRARLSFRRRRPGARSTTAVGARSTRRRSRRRSSDGDVARAIALVGELDRVATTRRRARGRALAARAHRRGRGRAGRRHRDGAAARRGAPDAAHARRVRRSAGPTATPSATASPARVWRCATPQTASSGRYADEHGTDRTGRVGRVPARHDRDRGRADRRSRAEVRAARHRRRARGRRVARALAQPRTGAGRAARRRAGRSSTCAPARTPRTRPHAAAIEGAGLIYLSGGNPAYLAETLRQTAVWHAIVARARGGSRARRTAAPARWPSRDGLRGCARCGRSSRPGSASCRTSVSSRTSTRWLGWVPDMLRNALLGLPDGVDAARHRRGHRARRRTARVDGAGPPVGLGPRPRQARRAPRRLHPHPPLAPLGFAMKSPTGFVGSASSSSGGPPAPPGENGRRPAR